MRLTTLFVALAVLIAAGCCSTAHAQGVEVASATPVDHSPVHADLGDFRVSVTEKSTFTLAGPGIPEVKTVGDPILYVGGVKVGHWPGPAAAYDLGEGKMLACFATSWATTGDGAGDCHTIWIIEGPRKTVITGVNTSSPKVFESSPLSPMELQVARALPKVYSLRE